MAANKPTVWTADAVARGYLTPEGIREAAEPFAGDRDALLVLAAEVLWALNDRACEDWRCCAFVMGDVIESDPRKARAPKEPS